MNKTYIAHLQERYIEKRPDGEEWLQMPVNVSGHESMIRTVIPLTPYTEPDTEQVREEAFKNGYDAACKDIDVKSKINAAYRKGLEDAWDAARKIESLSAREFDKVFTGYDDCFKVFENYTPQEAIEKIRQYEQEQEDAEFHVGDEFVTKNNKDFGVIVAANAKRVLVLWKDDADIFDENNREFTTKWAKERFAKTGRNFPEIAEVLRKMQEEES